MKGLDLKYFVLKPKGDNEYAEASRAAMLAYANSIEKTNSKLANDLVGWVHNELPSFPSMENEIKAK